MQIYQTKISGLIAVELQKHSDERGWFLNSFNKDTWQRYGIEFEPVEIARSKNLLQGTLRGLHFQYNPYEQGKIIQCIRGAVFDVAVDLRKDSSTYGKWAAERLEEGIPKLFFIPKGFAHGYQALSDDSEVEYFMSAPYNQEAQAGIRWNDPDLAIPWPVSNPILSKRDQGLPLFRELKL